MFKDVWSWRVELPKLSLLWRGPGKELPLFPHLCEYLAMAVRIAPVVHAALRSADGPLPLGTRADFLLPTPNSLLKSLSPPRVATTPGGISFAAHLLYRHRGSRNRDASCSQVPASPRLDGCSGSEADVAAPLANRLPCPSKRTSVSIAAVVSFVPGADIHLWIGVGFGRDFPIGLALTEGRRSSHAPPFRRPLQGLSSSPSMTTVVGTDTFLPVAGLRPSLAPARSSARQCGD